MVNTDCSQFYRHQILACQKCESVVLESARTVDAFVYSYLAIELACGTYLAGSDSRGFDINCLAEMHEGKQINITYMTPESHHRERQVIHDLLLPETFHPVLNDGELIDSIPVTP